MKRVCLALFAIASLGTASPEVTVTAELGPWAGRGPWSVEPVEWEVEIPFKVFDNVYYVGTSHVSSYLITTSVGLVLIDATAADAVEGLLDRIAALGFDPKQIEYLLITHPHNDHYGGAVRIQELTGATVCMSGEDWSFLERRKGREDRPQYQWTTDPAPARDRVIEDGEVIRLGDSTFTFYVTPGHTPGSLSMEYVVVDGDRSYRALTPGGLGFSYGPEWNRAYIASFERLRKIGHWDVVLSNHPFMMPVNLFRSVTGPASAERDEHPVVRGRAEIDAWLAALLEVAREKEAAERQPD